MKLQKVLSKLHIETKLELEITHIAGDSRKVIPGTLFVAINGYSTDGHNFIKEAIKKGAVAIIGEKQHSETHPVPYFEVENSRYALALCAKTFYAHERDLPTIIGITGTNGKTTTSFLIKHILEVQGYSCALFGTIGYTVNGTNYEASNTTPDALTLYKLLGQSNDEFAILEVSSHGIQQGRVYGLELDYVLFTNLDHEHLDYHHSMENYFQVKASLFKQLKKDGHGIIFSGQSWGKRLVQQLQNKHEVISISESDDADLKIDYEKKQLKWQDHSLTFQPLLPGKHNFINISMAVETCRLIGLSLLRIKNALEKNLYIPGRYEIFAHPNGGFIVVDYAHTSDALQKLFHSIQEQGAERIIHVFGFRGGRDKLKRKDMFRQSTNISHQTILTCDDLYGVEPQTMFGELLDLYLEEKKENSRIIFDRTEAITFAWELAEKGDWIVITGKGHEPYQQDFQYPVKSDLDMIKKLLGELEKEHSAL
ncbi:UDP-N-acetylmuramoyl-L-alanyl-D-glutamate--2,6-diaminopimelate ligase [Bacillaceae bacterium S4-13-58]